MKTDVIVVSSQGNHMEDALAQAEKVSAYHNLSPKATLHLRLLTEETMAMLRAISGAMDGEFWIENEADQFELHLKVRTLLDEKKREQLIAVSSSGINEAAKGFMGKIRAFFEAPNDAPAFHGAIMPFSSPHAADNMVWSMEDYREQLRQAREQKKLDTQEAWDELEKSVVARVADEVKVSIRGRTVEMIISKKLA